MNTGQSAVSQPDLGKWEIGVKNVTLSWEEGLTRKIGKNQVPVLRVPTTLWKGKITPTNEISKGKSYLQTPTN